MPRVKGSSRWRNNASILMLPCRTDADLCEAVLAVLANVDAGMYPYPPITMDHYLP